MRSPKSPSPLQSLTEYVDLVVERRMREVDVSDGSRVPHGSKKHVKDLEARIKSLTVWRDKGKKGTEARANYARVINRLKSELASAKRAAAKKMSESVGEPPEEEEIQRWTKLYHEETPDDTVKQIVRAFKAADDQQALQAIRQQVVQRKGGGLLSTVVTDGFIQWLYSKRAAEIGVNPTANVKTVRKLR
jgi:hypothetical protein